MTGTPMTRRTLREARFSEHLGFMLVEIMVIIIIVCILVAVAAPLYSTYVEKSKITEALNIIGAIISSEMLEMQRHPSRGFYAANAQAAFMAKGMRLSETKYFTYEVATSQTSPATTFTVTAWATSRYRDNPDACFIRYTHNPSASPAGRWSCDGNCITLDMIPGQ